MKFKERFIHQLSNLGQAYRRYPVTMILFIVLSILNAWQIVESFDSYERLAHGLVVAILLTMVATHINERFINDQMKQWAVLVGAVVLAVGYYLLLPQTDTTYLIYEVRTAVLVFALFVAFIWIPSIQNKQAYFYQMFLAAFKYGFTTILYGLILTLGSQAIISSIDYLLFSISYDYFTHAANIIWFIFAPSYFLSLIPLTTPDTQIRNELVEKDVQEEAFKTTNFLRILINYIVIPLTGIYTLILLAYIVLNIRGEFWSDNLLEPMLISYTIVILLVYLLASNMDEPIAIYFNKIFPKVMLPIVLFQTIASALEIQKLGVTHGRYYVIIFGIFAIVAGLVFSFLRKEKAGLIVPVLVVLAVISVIPPIDAFTVAKKSQMTLLTETLIENDMLSENTIIASNNVNREDKEKITKSVEYLYYLNYPTEIAYLEDDFDLYSDFDDTFGFAMYYEESDTEENFTQYVQLNRPTERAMSINEEDYFAEIYLANYEDEELTINMIELNEDYTIQAENSLPYFMISIENRAGDEVLGIDLEPLFTQAFAANISQDNLLEEEDMTLVVENEELRIRIVALDLTKGIEDEMVSGDFYIFVDIKD